MVWKKRGGGFGTTLVLALMLVLVSVALGVGIARFDFMGRMPVVGAWLFEEQPARTTTSPVVVEGIQDLDELATVRVTESVIITRESGGTQVERIFHRREGVARGRRRSRSRSGLIRDGSRRRAGKRG